CAGERERWRERHIDRGLTEPACATFERERVAIRAAGGDGGVLEADVAARVRGERAERVKIFSGIGAEDGDRLEGREAGPVEVDARGHGAAADERHLRASIAAEIERVEV